MIDAYRGISRAVFPGWQGWKIVSDYEKFAEDKRALVQLCDNNIELQELVAQFYEGGEK